MLPSRVEKTLHLQLLPHWTSQSKGVNIPFYGSKMQFSMEESVYILINSSWRFFYAHPCKHLPFLVILVIVIVTGVRWYLTVLIYISLMISDAEHYFSSLSLEKCLFRSCHLLIRSFVLMLSYMHYLYILQINLSDILFTSIFSHSVVSLFIFFLIIFFSS